MLRLLFQAQLRLTAQRLGQMQDKMDAQGQITRRDVAYLLQQRNVAIARAKTQKLIRDDVYGDLLQTLEMLIGVLLEHIGELDHRYVFVQPRLRSRRRLLACETIPKNLLLRSLRWRFIGCQA